MNFAITIPSESLTELKIRSFRSLPLGWRYGRGGPLERQTVDLGLGFCRLLYQLGLTRTDAFAGESGEVMIAAYQGQHYVEIVIEADLTVTVVHEDRGNTVTERERLALADAIGAIRDIAKAIWNTSGFFTPTTTTGFGNASSAWHSKIQPTGESLSSKPIALSELEVKSAPMPAGITVPASIQSLSSSGDLTTPIFRLQAA